MDEEPEPPQPAETAPSLEEIRSLFPDLEIIRLLAAGGMGAVYQVRQPTLARFAALKILPRNLASRQGFRERFHREALAMAALNHPNIVTIHQYGERDGLFFLLMEYVDGGDLGQAIRSNAISPRQVHGLIRQICDALQYAHDAGVIHRDIKPGNILLGANQRVKIADFGIAKMVGDLGDSRFIRDYMLGTPEYMAPEQSGGARDIDHRADLYSLGAVFRELLTSSPPDAGNPGKPPKRAALDPRLESVIKRAMAPSPALRYQQASEIRSALDRIEKPRTRKPWVIAALCITAGGFIAIASRRGSRQAAADPLPPPWQNSIGMMFRPIPMTNVKMSIWETRVRDWQEFEKSDGSSHAPRPDDTPDEPVAVKDDIKLRAFCTWLTRIERSSGRIPKDYHYRLPSDHEWSLAVGLRESSEAKPEDLHLKNREHHPWGILAPVPPDAGNYPDSALRERLPSAITVPNYYDGRAFASGVGGFPPNAAGFHDLGGNVWEAVATGEGNDERLLFRGGSWLAGARSGDWTCLLSSFRAKPAEVSDLEAGFRVVLAPMDGTIQPAILALARDGDTEGIRHQLAKGADPRQRDSLNRGALHLAATGRHAATVAELIRAGADIDSPDQFGATPLHAAAASGCLPAVESLVAAGAKIGTRNRFSGAQATHYAAVGNHLEVLKWLAANGADLKSRDVTGSSPLHHAASNRADAVIEWLVGQGIPADFPNKEMAGMSFTPLGAAILSQSADTCALLLRLGASPNAPSTAILSPLSFAAIAANPEIVTILLRHGADPTADGIGAATSLDLASCQTGKPSASMAAFQNLPLQWLPSKPGRRSQVIRLLLEHGMPLEQRDAKGFTPLLNAAYRGNIEAVQTLLEFGADPSATDHEGFNALHSAAEQGFVKVVELLLANGAGADVPNRQNRTAIDCAAIRGHADVVARLLDAGACADGLPSAESSPVATAAQSGRPATLRLLLEHGADPDRATKSNGMTPVICAAAGPGYLKASVAPPGAVVSPPGSEEDFTECLKLLLAHGADPHATMSGGTTALHSAANFNHSAAVAILIDAGLSPNTPDQGMFTALHRAAQSDSLEAATVLLDRGASVSIPFNPSTPLHAAAAAGACRTAQLLLERGADPNLRDGKSATPLHWAVSLGQTEVVALLARHKADLAARDFCYNTPLHCAVAAGKPEIVRALLDAGADPSLRNIEGATPMDFAVARHHEEMIGMLSDATKH